MYFYDTYALIELIRENSKYERFQNFKVVCILNNLFELHQSLLRQFNKKTADFWVDKFSLLEVTTDDIIKASDFRYKRSKDKLSMTDCIGYVVAKRNRLKFLTGDEKFEDMDNVEFIKK